MTTKTKVVLLGVLVRWVFLIVIAAPVMLSILAAISMYTFYDWQGRAALLILAGVIGTVANIVAACWAWEECDLIRWLASLDFEEVERKGRPLYD